MEKQNEAEVTAHLLSAVASSAFSLVIMTLC